MKSVVTVTEMGTPVSLTSSRTSTIIFVADYWICAFSTFKGTLFSIGSILAYFVKYANQLSRPIDTAYERANRGVIHKTKTGFKQSHLHRINTTWLDMIYICGLMTSYSSDIIELSIMQLTFYNGVTWTVESLNKVSWK